MKNVGFLGAGNMGYAIMKGISGSSLKDIKLFAFDLSEEAKKRGGDMCFRERTD